MFLSSSYNESDQQMNEADHAVLVLACNSSQVIDCDSGLS